MMSATRSGERAAPPPNTLSGRSARQAAGLGQQSASGPAGGQSGRQRQAAAHPGATPPQPTRRRRFLAAAAIVALTAGAAAGYYFVHGRGAASAGIIRAVGRLEVHEFALTSAAAAPLAEIAVNEGDVVTEGQVIAKLDLAQAKDELAHAEALIAQTKLALDAAQAEANQRRNQFQAADGDLKRWQARAVVTRAQIDLKQSVRDTAQAALTSATADETAAEQAYDAARKDAEVLRAALNNDRIVAPKDARIQYRLADIGQPVERGSTIVTMIDPTDVTLAVDVPGRQADEVKPGAEARVVFEGAPNVAFAATVAFVGARAGTGGATPDADTVRVRLHVAPDLARDRQGELRTGMPAIGYIATRPNTEWPAQLRPRGS